MIPCRTLFCDIKTWNFQLWASAFQVLCAVIDGGAAYDIAFGLHHLTLLHIRQVFSGLSVKTTAACWTRRQSDDYSDLDQLSITSKIKPLLPPELPLNGKRFFNVCPLLWFLLVVGVWSLTHLFCWPAIMAQQFAHLPSRVFDLTPGHFTSLVSI